MKKNYTRLILFAFAFLAHTTLSTAQVGINTTKPEGVLDVNDATGTNKYGLVLPRVALVRTNLTTPVVNPDPAAPAGTLAIGTVVYNTATTNFGRESVYPGIYMWDGIDWVNEFPKKNATIYKQTPPLTPLRTVTAGSYQDIPNLVNRTFTPEYSGTYKIEISTNYGGGTIQNLGTGTDVAVQKGNFSFDFDGDDTIIPAHTWSGRHGSGTNYYLIWEQTTKVIYKDLTAGTTYNFSLKFDQTQADGFVNNGDSGDGMGYIGMDIPCTVEFVYLD